MTNTKKPTDPLAAWQEKHGSGLSEEAHRELDRATEARLDGLRRRFRNSLLAVGAVVGIGGGAALYTGKQAVDAAGVVASEMVLRPVREVEEALMHTISDFLNFSQAYFKNATGTLDGFLSVAGDVWDGMEGIFVDSVSTAYNKDFTIQSTLAAMDSITADKPKPIPEWWGAVKADIHLLQEMKKNAEAALADPAAFKTQQEKEAAQQYWEEFKRQMLQKTREAKSELASE